MRTRRDLNELSFLLWIFLTLVLRWWWVESTKMFPIKKLQQSHWHYHLWLKTKLISGHGRLSLITPITYQCTLTDTRYANIVDWWTTISNGNYKCSVQISRREQSSSSHIYSLMKYFCVAGHASSPHHKCILRSPYTSGIVCSHSSLAWKIEIISCFCINWMTSTIFQF